MQFRVLGAVEACTGGCVWQLGPPQRRLVLAVLAVEAGRTVSVETLVDRVWDDPPAGARRAVQVHIARIRKSLEQAQGSDVAVGLVRRSGGYLLDLDPQSVDVHRFRRLVMTAREEALPHRRATVLREALGLWRGTPLTGLPGRWASHIREAWSQEHLDATVGWARAELDAGNPSAVLGPLTGLAGEHPLAEPVVAVLMRALYAAGRAGEALDRYATTRRTLADELGIDPGPELQALHRAILRGDLDRAAPRGPAAQPSTGVQAAPAQLPMDVRGFAGRTEQLAELDRLLAGPEQRSSVVVVAVSGSAGVGKSALAVHWAHRVRSRYPDGQVYMNLRGFTPGASPLSVAEAISGLLQALRVPAQQIPAGEQAQIGLYRSLVADKRMLLLLDNARDSEQVRPLLPGASGCLVVVTSRNLLASLAAADGAHLVALDRLRDEEAQQMLAARLGRARVAAEPTAVHEIVGYCAGLPLALTIAAARAAVHPSFPLAALADELRTARGGLDAFADADAATDLRAAFTCSYDMLSRPAARLFRLLGLHPGPDLGAGAVPSIAGITPEQARGALDELTRAHLLAEQRPGRYHFHDLLRAYARELVDHAEPEGERVAAVHRIVGHYLHTAYAGARLLDAPPDQVTLAPRGPGVIPEDLLDRQQALAWFTAEHRVLVAVIELAASATHPDTWRLAWATVEFFETFLQRHDLAHTQALALGAAQRLADPLGQALTHRTLSRALLRLYQYDDARRHLHRALDLFERLGDGSGLALTHLLLGTVCGHQGEHQAALSHSETALRILRTGENLAGLATALNDIGWCYVKLDDYAPAVSACEEALQILQRIRYPACEAATWDTLGYARHGQGRYREAAACYGQALDLYRTLDNRYGQAVILDHLGDTHQASGAAQAARVVWRLALQILRSLAHPQAGEVEQKIRASGGSR